jgi:hypothetical protein
MDQEVSKKDKRHACRTWMKLVFVRAQWRHLVSTPLVFLKDAKFLSKSLNYFSQSLETDPHESI